MEVPAACTLNGDDAVARVEEWRRFIAGSVAEVQRTDAATRLRLVERDDVLLAAVDLMRREKSCCGFFSFHLQPLPDAVWVEIRVEGDRPEDLDALVPRP